MNLKKLSIIILLVATLSLLSIVPVNAAVKNVAFDSEYYANSYADIKAAFGNDADAAYNHFVNIGIKEGRVASPVFDVVTYVLYYPDLQAAFGTDYAAAYNHFISTGVNEGRLGSAEFNVNAYLANYPDLKEAFGTDYAAAFNHFVNVGVNEGRIADVLVPGATAPEEHVHDYSVFVEYTVEPTCKKDGEAQYACSICGENAPETVVVKASEDFHEWKETASTADGKTKAATCKEDGLQYYICTICKETKSEVVPASDAYHQYGDPTIIAGQNVYECELCGYLKKEQINCEHSYKEVSNTATCTEPGVKISVCNKCQDVKTEDVSPLGHYVETDAKKGIAETTRITKQKTCTTDGEASGICTRCKKSVVVTIPASHNYVVAEGNKNATCDKDGLISEICLDCDNVVYETVKAKGHTEPTDKSNIKYYKVEPIFDSEGAVTGYKKYSEGTELEEFTKMTKSEINEILCNYGIIKVFKCESVSSDEDHFTACGKEDAEVVFYEYVGHKYVTTVDPTCEKTGTKVCSVCDEEVTIHALGHDFTGNSVIKTTAQEGTNKGKEVDTSYCNRCHEVVEVTVAPKVETNAQPKFNSSLTVDGEVDTPDEQAIDRTKNVTITTTPVASESNNNYNYTVNVKQTTEFAANNKVDDKKTHSNCICIVLDIGIKASNLEVVGGDYEIGPDDIKTEAVKQWTGSESPADTQFIVWLLPSEMGNGYTITFRDKENPNSYPVSVTFTFEAKAN